MSLRRGQEKAMFSRRHGVVALAALALTVAGTGVAAMTASAAAAGCRVDYAISSQWQSGFGANVTITNLGDAINGWKLTWAYAAGQTVTQAWNASVTQSGANVAATNASYNATIATNASVSFGFNGAWTGSNPTPTSFALNGATCTGAATPTTPTTPTTTPSTPAPTASPTISPTPTASPTPSSAPPPGRPSQCAGSSPITCHFAVAPGNYTVTAWIGDAASAGNTAMWVETRRRILPVVSTAAGAITKYVFTINVREPEGQPTGQGGTGTPGLDVTFNGSAPRLSGLTVAPANKPLVVYLAGDSTVCDQPGAPYAGWGQILPTHVGAGAVIANYGDSGENSGSFLNAAALFPTMRPLIKANDLVLIQFGHNDKATTAAAYRSNLTSMITQVRAQGGVPVLVTPPVRRLFDGAQLKSDALHISGLGVNLPAEMRSLATAQRVPLIDLTAKTKALVETLGPANSAKLYLTAATDGVTDNTHFSEYGAGQVANLVVQGVQELKLSLVPYLR
jgi:lysophospholipase L1-like esterase